MSLLEAQLYDFGSTFQNNTAFMGGVVNVEEDGYAHLKVSKVTNPPTHPPINPPIHIYPFQPNHLFLHHPSKSTTHLPIYLPTLKNAGLNHQGQYRDGQRRSRAHQQSPRLPRGCVCD